MYVCMCVCMYVCVYVCMYVCMYVCVYMCMCVCMYMYVCVYVCVYVCMYVCMYINFYRPHFSLDVDSKEEYFIELILSRHARKLLSSRCIKDLGLFAAHLDFDLVQWMGKERCVCVCRYLMFILLSDIELPILKTISKHCVSFTNNSIGLFQPHQPSTHPQVLPWKRLLP